MMTMMMMMTMMLFLIVRNNQLQEDRDVQLNEKSQQAFIYL